MTISPSFCNPVAATAWGVLSDLLLRLEGEGEKLVGEAKASVRLTRKYKTLLGEQVHVHGRTSVVLLEVDELHAPRP